MFCSNCGSTVSETEKFCPKCGYPVQSEPDEAPNAKPEPAVADGAKKAAKMGKEILQKVSGKKMVPLIAVAAAAVVLVVVVIANAARLGNFMKKSFSSPENYYQYVEKKAAKELSASAGDMYAAYLDALNYYDRSVSTEVSIELGKDGQEYLELAGLLGVDLSWLKSISVKGNWAAKNGVYSLDAGIAMNKDDILSGGLIMDTEKESLYVQIPELTKTYIGVDLGDFMSSYEREMLDETMESNKALADALPSQSDVQKISKKYLDIALGCIDDISKKTEKETVEGVTQKFTAVEVTIDDDTLQDIMKAVLKEMKKDKDIKKIIRDVAEAVGEDGDDVYEEFQESIEYTLDDIKYYSLGDFEELVMTVYVDGKGNISGRSLKLKSSTGRKSDSATVKMLMTEKGSKFGYELSVSGFGSESVKLTGSGKKSGDKISGDFKLKYNGTSVVDVAVKNFDLDKAKKGQLDGAFEISASSKIGSLIGSAMAGSVIEDVKLVLTFGASKNTSTVSLGVEYDGDDLGKASVSVKTDKGSKASIPSGKNVVMVEDMDDLEDWLETIDWGKVISKLKKTGLPSEVLDLLEDAADMIEDGNLWYLIDDLWDLIDDLERYFDYYGNYYNYGGYGSSPAITPTPLYW